MKKYSELATRVIAGLISLSTMVGAGAIICNAATVQNSSAVAVESEYETAVVSGLQSTGDTALF